MDRWRRRQLPRYLAPEQIVHPEVQPEDPLAGEFTDEMQAALQALPTELRETLLLVVVGELTHQEVADMLEIPLGTILSRVSRGRKRLREQLLAVAKATSLEDRASDT